MVGADATATLDASLQRPPYKGVPFGDLRVDDSRRPSRARLSRAFSSMRVKPVKTEEKEEPKLVVTAYSEICAKRGVRPNTGLLKYLESLEGLEANAITTLDLNSNHLGESQLGCVIELVDCSQCLVTLRLSQQCINSKILGELVSVVGRHRSLRVLDLSHNPLAIAASRMLSELARNTKVLEEINVEGTKIDESWYRRISTCLGEVAVAREEGLVKEPIYRHPHQHRFVYLLIATPDYDSFSLEIDCIRKKVLPPINAALQDAGVTVVPLVPQLPHSTPPTFLDWVEAVAACTDRFNCGLPWVLLLDSPLVKDTTPRYDVPPPHHLRPSLQPLVQDLEGTVTACNLVKHLIRRILVKVPRLPPLVDKNGCRRGPLRARHPSVFTFYRGAQHNTPGPPPATASLQDLDWSTVYTLPDGSPLGVFAAATASQLLKPLNSMYSIESVQGNEEQVAASAEELGLTVVMAPAELYISTGRPWCNELWKRQWRVVDALLTNYCERPAEQQELYGYAYSYEPDYGETYPTVVYGRGGVGKTALLARVAMQLRRVESDTFAVIPAFIGYTDDMLELPDVLRYLTVTVGRALDVEEDMKVETDVSIATAKWLDLVKKAGDAPRKVAVVLCGTDRILQEAGHVLLPVFLPPNFRIITSMATESPLLPVLRKRSPQPFEMLLDDLPTAASLRLLHSLTNIDWVLPSDTRDEGVILRPSNIPDAIRFMDNSTVPLFTRVLAEMLHLDAAKLTSQEAMMKHLKTLPEVTIPGVQHIVKSWSVEYGEALVEKALCILYSFPGGIGDDELLELLEATPSAKHPALLLLAMRPFLLRRPTGMLALFHTDVAAAISQHYPKWPVESHCFSPASVMYFRKLMSVSSSAHSKERAAGCLVKSLIGSGRVMDAHRLLSNWEYIEFRIQRGHFWRLVSDYEMVEGELRRAAEAGVEGFETFQLRRMEEIAVLRGFCDVLAVSARALEVHPYFFQVAINLPPAHPCRVQLKSLEDAHHYPYPVLKHINQAHRPTLSSWKTRLSDELVHVSFSPSDFALLVATSKTAVYVMRAVEGTITEERKLQIPDEASAPPRGFLSSSFTTEGSTIVTVSRTQITVWAWRAKDPILHHLFDFGASITNCLSPDGSVIVATQIESGKGCIIDTLKGRVISTLPAHADGTEPIRNISFASMCPAVLAVGHGIVTVYQGQEQVEYSGHQGLITCADITPDGKHVASADGRLVHVWSATTGELYHCLDAHLTSVQSVRFHPGGHVIATADVSGCVMVWSTLSGQEAKVGGLQCHMGRVEHLEFMPGGTLLAARCPGGVSLWNAATYEPMGVLAGHDTAVGFLDMCRDQERAATVASDGQLIVWEVEKLELPSAVQWNDTSCPLLPGTNLLERCDVHTEGITSIAVVDSRLVVSLRDGSVHLWSLATGRKEDSLLGRGVVSILAVPDSTVFIVGKLSTLAMIDYKTEQQVMTMPIFRGLMNEEDGAGVHHLTMSPNGQFVACTLHSTVDTTLGNRCEVFDVVSRHKVASLTTHRAAITGTAFLTDDWVVTGSRDKTVKLWDTARASCDIDSFAVPGEVRCTAACRRKGASLVACGLDNGVLGVVRVVHQSRGFEKGFTTIASLNASIVAVDVAGEGEYVVSCSADYCVQVHTVNHPKCVAAVMLYSLPTALHTTTPREVTSKSTALFREKVQVVAGDDSGRVYLLNLYETPAGVRSYQTQFS